MAFPVAISNEKSPFALVLMSHPAALRPASVVFGFRGALPAGGAADVGEVGFLYDAAELLAGEIVETQCQGIVAHVREPHPDSLDDEMDRLTGLVVRRLVADVRNEINLRHVEPRSAPLGPA